MIEGKDKAETIKKTAAVLGISEQEAEFIWAIEHDEITGDVIAVDDLGKPLHTPSAPASTAPSTSAKFDPSVK